MWIQHPRPAGQGFAPLDHQPVLQFVQRDARGNAFHLCPIFAFVGVARVQEFFIPFRLIAQQQQTFRIRVQPANGIHIFGKAKFRQRTVRRAVAGELRQHAVGLVKGDQHPPSFKPEVGCFKQIVPPEILLASEIRTQNEGEKRSPKTFRVFGVFRG